MGSWLNYTYENFMSVVYYDTELTKSIWYSYISY